MLRLWFVPWCGLHRCSAEHVFMRWRLAYTRRLRVPLEAHEVITPTWPAKLAAVHHGSPALLHDRLAVAKPSGDVLLGLRVIDVHERL